MTALTQPSHAAIKPKLSRDDIIMRVFMVIIGLYLVVTLVLPLYTMMSKSFSTYGFDLSAYEFQVDKGDGWGPQQSAEKIAETLETGTVEQGSVSGDTRLAATKLFNGFLIPVQNKIPRPHRQRRRHHAVRLRAHRRPRMARILFQRLPATDFEAGKVERHRQFYPVFFHPGAVPVDLQLDFHCHHIDDYHGVDCIRVCLCAEPLDDALQGRHSG